MPDATPPLRVLVIDDSVDNAEMLAALLAVMGCLTAVAYTGGQGLAADLAFGPQLVFIDLEMPDMGGCEVVRQLRASHARASVRCVCLTGRGRPEDRRICLEAGFDDFYTKPLKPDMLARVLATSSAAHGHPM
jgi:CheY-like chemotaxis protein